MKCVVKPTDKKALATCDVLTLNIVEARINAGYTKEEVKKQLYKEVNDIDDTVKPQRQKGS